VRDLTDEGPSVERELALVKVVLQDQSREAVQRLVDNFRVRVVDTGPRSLVFEVVGATDELDGFIDQMRPLGLVEVSRTGIAAIARGAEGLKP